MCCGSILQDLSSFPQRFNAITSILGAWESFWLSHVPGRFSYTGDVADRWVCANQCLISHGIGHPFTGCFT